MPDGLQVYLVMINLNTCQLVKVLKLGDQYRDPGIKGLHHAGSPGVTHRVGQGHDGVTSSLCVLPLALNTRNDFSLFRQKCLDK